MKRKRIVKIKNILISFSVILISCSSSNQKDININIFDGTYDANKFSIELFENIGFKIYKSYDVSNLVDAEGAYYGFWGDSEFDKREYELRFYPTNKIAISSGKIFADEVTGKNAIIKKSDSSWKEGIKDRRTAGVFGNSKNAPRYMDYVIFGNVIVLCSSEKSSAVSGASDPIENCRKMLSKLNIISN